MRRMPKSSLRCLAVLFLGIAACSGGPELSDDGRSVRRVDGLVMALARAYEQKDLQALLAGTSPTMPVRDALRGSAERAFARYDRIELAVSIDRVHLDGKTATVFLHWDGRWAQTARDPLIRQGTARFVVDASDPALLTDVVGESPFAPLPDVGSLP
jgi:hypothetical protein